MVLIFKIEARYWFISKREMDYQKVVNSKYEDIFENAAKNLSDGLKKSVDVSIEALKSHLKAELLEDVSYDCKNWERAAIVTPEAIDVAFAEFYRMRAHYGNNLDFGGVIKYIKDNLTQKTVAADRSLVV
jgi:hypothetical protein